MKGQYVIKLLQEFILIETYLSSIDETNLSQKGPISL